MKYCSMVLTTVFMACLPLLVTTVNGMPGAKAISKLQSSNPIKSRNKESPTELEGGSPDVCYCNPIYCSCCNVGHVHCPGRESCCPDNYSYCCSNAPYCCPASSAICCVNTGLCCSDSAPQCCPETCCSNDETCCGENCCKDEQKCCENGDEKFCCISDGEFCGDKYCIEGSQCCSEFNPEEQEMDLVCENKTDGTGMAMFQAKRTKDTFYVSKDDRIIADTDANTQLQLLAYAVGQGDCTIIACPNNDLVIIDMGSTDGTTVTAEYINGQLKDYFAVHTSSKMRVIVTHPHTDHYNYFQTGLDRLVSYVDYFILSGQYSQYGTFKSWLDGLVNNGSLDPNKINVINQGNKCFGNTDCKVSPKDKTTPVIDPQSLCGDDPTVKFTILAANLGSTTNSQSAVIKVQYDTPMITVILPGDFETQDAQDELVNHYQGTTEMQANIYKIAHHGASRLANFQTFLNAIQPQVAFVSQAYPSTNNAHPRCDAIEGLLGIGSIKAVQHDTNLHSPFACGIAAKTPHVYNRWCHAIYATCREPEECYNVIFTLYPDGAYTVKYEGPVPVLSV